MERVEMVAEMLKKFEEHPDAIAVREQINGKWQAVFLSELPDNLRRLHEARMIVQRIENEGR